MHIFAPLFLLCHESQWTTIHNYNGAPSIRFNQHQGNFFFLLLLHHGSRLGTGKKATGIL